MIQYVVEEAVASGLSEIIIVTGRGKRAIEDHFDAAFELEYYLNDRGKVEELAQIKTISELASVSYVRQKEPLGLGAVLLKDATPREAVLVLFQAVFVLAIVAVLEGVGRVRLRR